MTILEKALKLPDYKPEVEEWEKKYEAAYQALLNKGYTNNAAIWALAKLEDLCDPEWAQLYAAFKQWKETTK